MIAIANTNSQVVKIIGNAFKNPFFFFFSNELWLAPKHLETAFLGSATLGQVDVLTGNNASPSL